MLNTDKGFRERQRKLIRQRTQMITDYRAKHLDEKTKEWFRRPAYGVPEKSERSEDLLEGNVERKEDDDETNDHT